MIKKTVNVFGKTFKIKYDKTLASKGVHGVCDSDNNLILIDGLLKGDSLMQTLLHEEFHAVFSRIGLRQAVPDEVEEMIVDALATFIVDNYRIAPKK